MALAKKNVLLAVCGGIAAFKAASVASQLRKEGANVRCMMTQNATQFITPLTLGEISGNAVAVSMWSEVHSWDVEHIAMANWADVIIVAPATANCIGKIANGIADDMVTTVIMASKAPVIFAPAMNSNMFLNPIVQNNIQKLKTYGYRVMEPDSGMLACGIEGPGRLPEPQHIVDYIDYVASSSDLLLHKKVIVTAGGTVEAIDPVRYITNHSSGRMGFAIAKAAAMAGADVTLVAAPADLPTPIGVKRIDVKSTRDMKQAVDAEYDDCDIVIKAAAVADYRVKTPAKEKIKKTEENLVLELEKNPDILYGLGQRKTHQILVGFAAETTNLIEYAKAKLKKKNLDMLVANDVSASGAGFSVPTNIATLIFPDGHSESFDMMDKFALATIIIDRVSKLIAKL
jgi:phosphopantothenoylcysteine decarboxylase/phosphopantothenate--cysteine ligase